MSQRMQATAFSAITIDAEMVGKIYRLALATESVPTDDGCENLAVNLLDKALDAALLVHENRPGTIDLGNNDLKLVLAYPLHREGAGEEEVGQKQRPKKPKSKAKPVTVTFRGDLAAAIRSAATESRRTPQQVAENYCESGCDRPAGDSQRMFLEIPDSLRQSVQKLAEVAGYRDGLVDLALETWVDGDAILEAIARSLIRVCEIDAKQVGRIAATTMEEKLRHSANPADQWMAKNTLKMEVPES